MAVEPGDRAPDFELPSHTGDTVRLSDFHGSKPVVLVFYPFAFSPECEGELCQVHDDYTEFEAAGAEVLAVSCDNSHVQRRWADQHGWTFEVLSDYWPHGEVARRYGVFDADTGCAQRVTFVVDRDGTVVDRFWSAGRGTPHSPERYAEALAKL